MTARRSPFSPEVLTALLAAGATVAVCFATVAFGIRLSLGAVAAAGFFGGLVLTFTRRPHLGFAFTVVLLVFVPPLKVFVAPELGALKDLAVLAATVAAVVLVVFDGRRTDRWVVRLVGLLLAIYVINAGGGHDTGWAQGVRLVAEPLLLLLAGLLLPDPRRNLRWVTGTLIATALIAAGYGVLQQLMGATQLADLGYRYDDEIRFYGSQLRSFGTSDDSFGYTGLLAMAFAAVLLARRRSPGTVMAAGLLLVGIYVAFVRTAFLVVVGLVGIAVARRGKGISAVLVVVAGALLGASLLLTGSSGTEQRSFVVPSASGGSQLTSDPGAVNVVLNGRVSAWSAALGDEPRFWILGRGVGEVGTAASRASVSYVPGGESSGLSSTLAVDSGYVAAVADVGFIGLGVLLALLARLLALASAAGRQGHDGAWLALGAVFALMVDATSRASFTGFPTAYVAMLLAGVGIASATADRIASTNRGRS